MIEKSEKIATLLQIAVKAKQLVFGHDAVLKLIVKKKVLLVILAEDLGRTSHQSIIKHAEQGKIDTLIMGTKNSYYKVLGINTGIIGILDKNFKRGIVEIASNGLSHTLED